MGLVDKTTLVLAVLCVWGGVGWGGGGGGGGGGGDSCTVEVQILT